MKYHTKAQISCHEILAPLVSCSMRRRPGKNCSELAKEALNIASPFCKLAILLFFRRRQVLNISDDTGIK